MVNKIEPAVVTSFELDGPKEPVISLGIWHDVVVNQTNESETKVAEIPSKHVASCSIPEQSVIDVVIRVVNVVKGELVDLRTEKEYEGKEFAEDVDGWDGDKGICEDDGKDKQDVDIEEGDVDEE